MCPDPNDLVLPQGAKQAALVGPDAAEAKFEAALRHGIFCTVCGGPLDVPGWEYFSVKTQMKDGKPTVVVGVAFVCSRDTCTDARAELEQSAAARREARPWHIFEPQAPDYPPAEGSLPDPPPGGPEPEDEDPADQAPQES